MNDSVTVFYRTPAFCQCESRLSQPETGTMLPKKPSLLVLLAVDHLILRGYTVSAWLVGSESVYLTVGEQG